MAIIGEATGVFEALRKFVKEDKKPVSSPRPVRDGVHPFAEAVRLLLSQIWGTCAGMILLSNSAVFQKSGGQVRHQTLWREPYRPAKSWCTHTLALHLSRHLSEVWTWRCAATISGLRSKAVR